MTVYEEPTPKIDVKHALAALWVMHFLLWTFGDMLSLWQSISGSTYTGLLLSVAVPVAVIQVLMIILSLVGDVEATRWMTIILALIFFVYNLGFIALAQHGWEYLIGLTYVAVNGLIAWFAWKRPRK